ncbi:MAG: DUF6499 domain-containing protein [Pseudomonadota bacterium]
MPPDWRDPDTYAYFDTLDAPGMAWECLRRNPDYRDAYPDLQNGTGDPEEWGLRFPGRSRTHGA